MHTIDDNFDEIELIKRQILTQQSENSRSITDNNLEVTQSEGTVHCQQFDNYQLYL